MKTDRYSLVDVDERFNRLVLDPLYMRHLNMTMITLKSLSDRSFSIHNHVLDRICEQILPRIHHQVNELTIEQHSMERILTVIYLQLYSLSLVDFQEEILFQYLTGNGTLRNLLTEQITHLSIDIHNNLTTLPPSETLTNIFVLILSLCKRLINLNFCRLFVDRNPSICLFKLPSRSCISSTLTTLNINVVTFDDCLYLVDGQLGCLSTLIIDVEKSSFRLSDLDNTKQLPKLKHFSLTSFHRTRHYDNLIIPLLCRMINLEELILFLSVLRVDSTYIDGIQSHDDILIYMAQLKKFAFSMDTVAFNKNIKIDLSSKEDIQHSFIGRGYGPIGGMFEKVRYLLMTDSYPFEHQFFKLISQDFPFLKALYIFNVQPQQDKQQPSISIIFPHLVCLHLSIAHVDYAEQFLLETNTHLPRLLDLTIGYKSLVTATNNFTNDVARLKCAKRKILDVFEPFCSSRKF